MQDLNDKPSIPLHIAYQFWCIYYQGKARLLQHTNFQLETFWTLQVRVVILDYELYRATWYTMDGRKRYIRKRYFGNPILIESTNLYKFNKTVLFSPQSVLDTNVNLFSALRHLFLNILIWGRKVSWLSKRIPNYLFLLLGNCISLTQCLDGVHTNSFWVRELKLILHCPFFYLI